MFFKKDYLAFGMGDKTERFNAALQEKGHKSFKTPKNNELV